MTDTPSNQELYDEAAMQDAIAAKKATGGLVEVNPQDAPKPVQENAASYQRKAAPAKDFPPQPSAEDKAFSFVEKLNAQRNAAPSKGNGRN